MFKLLGSIKTTTLNKKKSWKQNPIHKCIFLHLATSEIFFNKILKYNHLKTKMLKKLYNLFGEKWGETTFV